MKYIWKVGKFKMCMDKEYDWHIYAQITCACLN